MWARLDTTGSSFYIYACAIVMFDGLQPVLASKSCRACIHFMWTAMSTLQFLLRNRDLISHRFVMCSRKRSISVGFHWFSILDKLFEKCGFEDHCFVINGRYHGDWTNSLKREAGKNTWLWNPLFFSGWWLKDLEFSPYHSWVCHFWVGWIPMKDVISSLRSLFATYLP